MSRSALKFDWYARLAELEYRDVGYFAQFAELQRPLALFVPKVDNALTWAEYFIESSSDLAEQNHWQPAHLLRPTSGLAWRVPPFDLAAEFPVRGFHGRCCAVQIDDLVFVYKADRSGDVAPVFGSARRRVLEALRLPMGAPPISAIIPDRVPDHGA